MTIQEHTGVRDLGFSSWVRKYLPDSQTGFMATDVDFFIYNYKTKKIMILEIKTHTGNIKTWQTVFYNNLSRWIRNGIDKDWEYLGFHLIRLENNSPGDGIIIFDNKEITELDLIKKLSF